MHGTEIYIKYRLIKLVDDWELKKPDWRSLFDLDEWIPSKIPTHSRDQKNHNRHTSIGLLVSHCWSKHMSIRNTTFISNNDLHTVPRLGYWCRYIKIDRKEHLLQPFTVLFFISDINARLYRGKKSENICCGNTSTCYHYEQMTQSS